MGKCSNVMEAVNNGNLEEVKIFAAGIRDIGFLSSLMCIAAKDGHFEVVKYFFEERGVDINARHPRPDQRPTSLYFAVLHNRPEIVRYLLAKGANVNLGSTFSTPLHLASTWGHLEIVKDLITAGANKETYDAWEKTPLHLAAENHRVEVVKYLIEMGAKISLHLAAERGYNDIVKHLIKKNKANVNACDSHQYTPLHLAAQEGHIEVVQYLIEQGADISAYNAWRQTPLHLAAREGHREVAQYLIERGADIDTFDNSKYTPLHLAAQKGHLTTVKYLIEQGADKKARNNKDRTPLHLAAIYGHLEVVQYLQRYYNKLPRLSSTIIALTVGAVARFIRSFNVQESIAASVAVGLGIEAFDFVRNHFANKELDTFKNSVENDPYFQKGQAAERSWIAYFESFGWGATYLPFITAGSNAFQAGRALARKQDKAEMTAIQDCLQKNKAK